MEPARYSIIDGVLLDGTGRPILTPKTRILLRHDRTRRSISATPNATAAFRGDQYRALFSSIYNLQAHWMNHRPSAAVWEDDKTGQAALSRRVGLQAIETCLTSDPDIFRAFVERQDGDVAVKSARPWLADVSGEHRAVASYTRRLTKKQALSLADRVSAAPVLVQPYVEKAYELRATVIDGRVFTCRIDSQRTARTSEDWRLYDLPNTPHVATALDRETEDGLLNLVRVAGLTFATIDLIVEPSGQIVFVEMNPSGQFGWIEALTGLPIHEAIADWLLSP